MTKSPWPVLGCGVGLRSPHYPVITNEWPPMDWFEAISENYMDTGGRPLHILEKVRQHYPIALHGTALSIGSIDPLNRDYLVRLKRLVERMDPFIVSDHLCWSGVQGEALHDLLPLPFTEEAIQHVARHVDEVQEFTGRRILLENVSAYVTYRHSTMPEWEFLGEVAKRSGCGILLDLNNLYVNSTNHNLDPHEYLRNIPGELVGQFHLAGHTDMGSFLFDTHGAEVIQPVWELYREALSLWGPVSTLIEWDENIPSFERLQEEAERARKIYREYPVVGAGLSARPDNLEFHKAGQPHRATPTNKDILPLPQLQQLFKSKIQPFEGDPSLSKKLKDLLNPQGGVSGEERLAVYAKGYIARITESLKEVYEAVRHVLGSEEFLKLCDAYARRWPSRNYNLNYAGKNLPTLLENHPVSQTFPFLPDLARLEWLIWEAFHAFDEIPSDPSQLSSLPLEEWENARILFQPSVHLLSSRWPILDIWQARHESPEKLSVDLNRSQRILIGRKADQVRCEFLDENQYRFLKGLLGGKSLGEGCEDLADRLEEETLPLAEWFSRWVRDGLILRLDFQPAPRSAV